MIDQPAPDLALPALPGRDDGLASADLAGEVTLVNFFASWCVPCLAEHPLLTRLAREDGIRVLGIAYKDEPTDTLAWLTQHGDPYRRIGVDLDGRAAIDWGVYGVPETFIVSGDGRILDKHIGPISPADLEDKILPLIRQARAQ